MPEASQVTVRLLPDEIAWEATVRARGRAEIELAPSPETIALNQDALVEIESLDTLVLGKVVVCEETRVLVAVEHTVDLRRLGRIQEVWHGSKA